MNKIFNVLLIITLFSFCALAQKADKNKGIEDKPNFSGTWIIDKEKSYSKSADRKNVSDYTLIITHSGNELKVFRDYTVKTDKNSYTEILYTDKRKEKNVDKTGMTMQAEIKSETFWKKQAIVRRFLYDRSGNEMPPYIISGEKYSLSKDGKVLTITIEYELSSNSYMASEALRQNGNTVPKRQLIFNKQE